ncbi:hypothetical protein ACFYOI_10545 [Streptomyces microflavus]|uniref:hypothetical protein n=1 Tax=Streptomyces microflavus TaxID=1919 RepID=UPI0033B84987
MALRRLSGVELLARHEDARRVYAEAFSGPPWSEDASAADGIIRRLTDDATRLGFTAAGAFRNDRLVGPATAWTRWPVPAADLRQCPRGDQLLGWTQATHPACVDTGITVFLGPRHPARTAVTLPL